MKTCGDLQKLTLAEMNQHHGKWGAELYRLCRGEDDRIVQPNRARKSLSSETTFSDFLLTLDACAQGLDPLIAEVLDYVEKKYESRNVRKAFVKVKFSDFTHTTRECISAQPTRETFLKLLGEARERKNLPVRLLGAGVRFVDEEEEEPSSIQEAVHSLTRSEMEQGLLPLSATIGLS
jgi:DNA polymerase-4